MSTFDELIDLDGNGRPIYGDSPFRVVKDHTFVATGAVTTVVPLFTLTGAVMVTRIWGVVTTDIANNHTAASFSLVETAGATIYLTSVGGTALSSLKAGSVILKDGLVAAALTKIDNVAGAIKEPTTLQTMSFSPIILVKKTAVVTTISYNYTSTGVPTTGAMRFYVSYYPLSTDGAITPA